MRLHETMGITQNRIWGVCSLNDFRRYLGLKRKLIFYYELLFVYQPVLTAFSNFLEWNSNREIAHAAEKLYGDIEYLELYVGLQAEEAKPVVDGAGLCPGEPSNLLRPEPLDLSIMQRLHHQSSHSQ